MLEHEIFELLRKQPVFSGLDETALEKLCGLGEVQNYSIGKNIITEGQSGHDAFLVYSGKVRLVKNNVHGKPMTLSVLLRGDFFGERGILTHEPHEATVRAVEDSVVVSFAKDKFIEFGKEHPELLAFFNSLAKDRAILGFVRSDTIMCAIPPKQVREVVEHLEPVDFKAGENIITQGELGETMYIINSGEAKVVLETKGKEKTLAFLGHGDYFGELALLSGEPRAASVVATQDMECLSLDRETFGRIIDRVPKLREQLTARIEDYHNVDDHVVSKQPRPEPVPARPVSSGSAEPDEPEQAFKPPHRKGRRYPWLRQNDATDCGAASLAMISRYYGKRLSISHLRDLANVNREGASMYSLAAAGEAIGYTTRAVQTDYQHLMALPLPAIVHWKGYHYIVLYEATAHKVVVGDPALGLLKMSREEFEAGWTHHALLLEPTAKLMEQKEQPTTLKRFLPLIKPHKVLLLEVLGASLLINLFGLASPVFTQTIIDKVLVHQDVNMLNLMLGGMLIIGLFTTVTALLRRYLLIHVSQKLSLRLASDLFRQVMSLSIAFFAKRKVGDILTRFADNQKIQSLLTGAAISTILDMLMVIVYLTVMFTYNTKLTAVALMFIPLSIGLTLIYTPIMRRNNQQYFEKVAMAQSKLIESIERVGQIKTATAELTTRWKYEDLIVQRANQAFHGAKLGMSMDAISDGISLLSGIVVLWYGAHLVIAGDISVGQLIAFNMLIGMVMSPILGLVGMWQTLQDAFLSLERLNDIYDAEPEEAQGADASLIHLPALRGDIVFENVSFRYSETGKNVISNVSLDIRAGQMVAIVGRSGSGKTTLISLLQRLYRPTEGRILVDGYDIATIAARSLRSQMGAVLQESAIFSGTIRENIALADPNATLAQVIHASTMANAHEFIGGYTLGYNTVIGDIGVGLSGGQRQRIAIARALLTEPVILLFDEATSALDTESERAIQENMSTMLEGRTSIVIAHRLSTIRQADVILVLDEGQIVEQGSHGELMTRRGLYYYLNSQQLES